MQLNKISLKAITVGTILLVGATTVALALYSGNRYREAAMSEQADLSAHKLDKQARQLVQQLAVNARLVGHAVVNDPAFQHLLSGSSTDSRRLVAYLEQSVSDLAGSTGLDGYRVAVYAADGTPLADSGELATDSRLSAEALRARQETGTGQGRLRLTPTGPVLSLLQPAGTPQYSAWLEIQIRLDTAVQRLEAALGQPLQLSTPAGDPLYRSDDWQPGTSEERIHVSHPLRDAGGQALLTLSAQQPQDRLISTMLEVRNQTAVAYVVLFGGALLIALAIFNRFLFAPVNALIEDMRRGADGDLDTQVREDHLREFSLLGQAFNRMTHKMKENLERERQTAEDLTGKVELIQEVVEMAARGDLTGQLMIYRDEDIISELASGVQGMLDSLNSLVARIQQAGIQVTSSVTEIAATAKQQEATVSEQAATTNEIRATVTQISATSNELVNTMHEVTDVALKTSEQANAGRSSLTRMEETMRHMLEATNTINSKLAVLSEKAANINTVVTTINKVSDQTNLLSLNAAIEAEKAGEYGVGFSVVATEIRRLADQTAVATWDIEQMVKEMQSAVSAGVMGMEKFSTEVRTGVDDVRTVSGQLGRIIEQVENLIPRYEEVHEGMQSQAQGANQINEAMVQLAETSQQTAESLRQSNGAIQQLNEAARRLQEGVSHIKLNV